MIVIPIFQNLSSTFTQEIVLGDRVLNLTLSWNTRAEAWFLKYEDVNTGACICGVKLVENWLLLRQYKAKIPNESGDFIVLRLNTDEEKITYDNLGVSFLLYYVTDEEGDEWENYYGIG